MEPLLAARVSLYRAPETDGGKEGTRTSDVYSLAVLIREMLPRDEASGRLYSLLERSIDPLPKNRPSSPRLLLEELEEPEGEDVARVPVNGALDRVKSADERGDELSFSGEKASPSRRVSLKKRPRLRHLKLLLLIVLGGVIIWLLFLAASGALTQKSDQRETIVSTSYAEKVTMPDLEGVSATDAEEILNGLGLVATSRKAPSRLWSASVIVAQEPERDPSTSEGTPCVW